METNIISELTTFIEHAPTAFHAVAELKEILKQEGFEELKESEKWKIKPGKRYYVTRNNSSIIAVKAGKELDNYSFHVTASHSDSPAFNQTCEGGQRSSDDSESCNSYGPESE